MVGAEKAKAREKKRLLVARKVDRGRTRQVLISQVKEFGFYSNRVAYSVGSVLAELTLSLP